METAGELTKEQQLAIELELFMEKISDLGFVLHEVGGRTLFEHVFVDGRKCFQVFIVEAR